MQPGHCCPLLVFERFEFECACGAAIFYPLSNQQPCLLCNYKQFILFRGLLHSAKAFPTSNNGAASSKDFGRASAAVGDAGLQLTQQPPCAECTQAGGVCQQVQPRCLREGVPCQKVPVSVHEPQPPEFGLRLQRCCDRPLDRPCALVVSNPHLEQVPKDEHGVSIRAGQVRHERLKCARSGLAKVKIGYQFDGLPLRRGAEVGNLRHGAAKCEGDSVSNRGSRMPTLRQTTSTALSMVTFSRGTSSWKPRRPVLTDSIASTTSCPCTTRPNTA